MLCPENTIKKKPGNNEDCLTDHPCNGLTRVPNGGHTACGNLFVYNHNEGF